MNDFLELYEEYNDSLGNSQEDLSGLIDEVINGYEKPNINSQKIDKENQKTEHNKKSKINKPSKVNLISINESNLLTEKKPQNHNKNSFIEKKRNFPKSKNCDNINSFSPITNIEKNTSKKFKTTSSQTINVKDKTSENSLCLQEEEVEKKVTKNEYNKDNYIKTALKAPYSSLVKLIEEYGGKKLKRVNLKNVFGGTEQNKKSIKLTLREIICSNEENEEILKNAKPKDNNIFNYILDSKYKFLLEHYYHNEKEFIINGKNVSIEDFKTFDEVKGSNALKCYSDIDNFEYIISMILMDFEGRKGRKRQKKGRSLITIVEPMEKFENTEKGNECNKNFSQQIQSNDEIKEEPLPKDDTLGKGKEPHRTDDTPPFFESNKTDESSSDWLGENEDNSKNFFNSFDNGPDKESSKLKEPNGSEEKFSGMGSGPGSVCFKKDSESESEVYFDSSIFC